ncbi:MAG TPA: sigma-E factor negative regulatory protein [Rhodanobacter sp.]|nr:sigma-E factor negative regulatory protein [Rhodanobacter sp.]
MKQAPTSQDVRESLCAGVDGELSTEQWRFLLRRLDHDVSLRQAWARYHVAGEGLRRQASPLASGGFAERVMQAIEQETAPVAVAESRRHGHWLRWSTGGAIAASVAVAALMISQPAGDGGKVGAPVHQQIASVASTLPASRKPAAPAAPATVPPWLSGNSAGLLSQQASFGEPFDNRRQQGYSRRLLTNPAMRGYRTLDNNDGSYLLLLDHGQPATAEGSRQAGAFAQ